MRAIIINAIDRTVTEGETDGKLKNLQRVVGGMIEAVYAGLDEAHHCYVDEEGMFKRPLHFFLLEGGQPLAGNGIVLGTTEAGEEAACTLPLDWMKERVTFMDLAAARRWVAHTLED